MTVRLDEVDRQIIYALMEDARNTSAPTIAEGLDVSAGTVRNRIERLEEEGVIRGYTATIDFEQADGRLTAIYMCTVPAADRERLALSARSIPGVIDVRILMAGRRDLHVVAVGESTEDLRHIARSLSELDIRVEDEELLQTSLHSPYDPFGDGAPGVEEPTDIDYGEVIEVTVADDATLAGMPVETAQADGLLEDAAVVSIQRGGELIQPTDGTVFEPGDIVALHIEAVETEETFAAFEGSVLE